MLVVVTGRDDDEVRIANHIGYQRIAQSGSMFIGKDEEAVMRHLAKEFSQCVRQLRSGYDALLAHRYRSFVFLILWRGYKGNTMQRFGQVLNGK